MTRDNWQRRVATYEDLREVADHLVAEIVDGELTTSPRPAPRHAIATSALTGVLEPPFGQGRGGPGGWRVLVEPEIHLGSDVVVPDIAAWRRERLPRLPDGAWFTLAPDWVCEVVSPSTVRLDRSKKLGVYARAHVADVWLVDPIERRIEVLRLDGTRWTVACTCQGHDMARLTPFAEIEFPLACLWPDDDRR